MAEQDQQEPRSCCDGCRLGLAELKVAVSHMEDVVKHVRQKAKEAQELAETTNNRLNTTIAWFKGLLVMKAVLVALMSWILIDRDNSLKALGDAALSNARVLERHTAILESHAESIRQQTQLLLDLMKGQRR